MELLPNQLSTADYRTISGVDCIYVETAEDPSGYVLRYWVSVDTGLLAAAEKLQEGSTVYRMAALTADQSELPQDTFLLPDGTSVLQ